MVESVDIPVAELLLDSDNPRLPGDGRSQQDVALRLAEQQGDHLVRLAADIAEHGLDPTVLLAVVPESGKRRRYTVIEGNRRLLALRALESPALISPVLSAANSTRLNKASEAYARRAVATVRCALFERRDEARRWIELRHTGQNQGAGLVEWGAEEQDRFRARQAGARKPAGQIMEFVEQHGLLSDAAAASRRRTLTTVERLIKTPYVREALGIDIVDGRVVAMYPASEVAKGLTHVVEDLKLGKLKVSDVYHVVDRQSYIDSLPRSARPKRSTRLPAPVVLDDLTAGKDTPATAGKKSRSRTRSSPRRTVIPKSVDLVIPQGRISAIYSELRSLNAEQYPNACSVLLRVFIELSIDAFIADRNLMTDDEMRNTKLAKRMKDVASHMEKEGTISAKLRRMVGKIADGGPVLAPTVPTFNQYVHNEYVFPGPAELFRAWDEIFPFMDALWA